jgi:hypothetical protein
LRVTDASRIKCYPPATTFVAGGDATVTVEP